jgi:hypothetical protein
MRDLNKYDMIFELNRNKDIVSVNSNEMNATKIIKQQMCT